MKKKFLSAISLLLLAALSIGAVAEQPQAVDKPKPYDGPYEIEVDIANQITTVYRGKGRTQNDIIRQMLCSTGVDNRTPLGTYTMPKPSKNGEREEWYFIGKYDLYVQYASRIIGAILFHSLPSVERHQSPTRDSLDEFGAKASHGCIRLRPVDSRWIAENCKPGTVVHIHDDAAVDEELRSLLRASSFTIEEMRYIDFLNGEKVYSLGSELPEVKQLQEKLCELGYELTENDGLFGARTEDAVLLWQQKYGFVADGEMNEEELELLLSQDVAQHRIEMPGKPAVVDVKTTVVMRSKADSNSKKLDSLPDGMRIRVLDKKGNWYKILANGQTGYIGRNFVEFVKE